MGKALESQPTSAIPVTRSRLENCAINQDPRVPQSERNPSGR